MSYVYHSHMCIISLYHSMCWYCTCHNKMASSVSMNPSDGPRPRSAALLDTQGFKPGETLMIGRRNRSVDSFRRTSLKTEGWKNQMLFPSDCVSLIQKKTWLSQQISKVMRHQAAQTCFRSFEKTARSSGSGWGRMGRKTLPSWKTMSVCIWWTVPYPELTWLLKKQFEDDFPFPEVG